MRNVLNHVVIVVLLKEMVTSIPISNEREYPADTDRSIETYASRSDRHGTGLTAQIEELLNDHAYELSIRPDNEGKPMEVTLALMIESITDISEKNMDLTFTLCMHENWVDPRLTFAAEGKNTSIVLPSRLVDKIWVPDLYVVGSKKSFLHSTSVDNLVLRLFSNGEIWYSFKITTTVTCQMNLYNFPLDTEKCYLTFQSLGYNTEEMTLQWNIRNHKTGLFMDARLVESMPKFRLVHHKFSTKNRTIDDESTRVLGVRSQLQVSFELERYLISVFFQSYFPAMIMVVLAGLGMWIDPKSVPARVAMGVTSVLTISTIITGLKATFPKVSYLTAMDIYLWVCFLFVFSTVMEFCVLNFIMTKRMKKQTEEFRAKFGKRTRGSQSEWEEQKKTSLADIFSEKQANGNSFRHQKINDNLASVFRHTSQMSPQSSNSRDCEEIENNTKITSRAIKFLLPARGEFKTVTTLRRDVAHLDVFFRVGYFCTFIAFNVVYWVYYVTVTRHEDKDE
ncbi:unnamed protein product [Clavelina lepadiformis]|uniref:Uncharacterized protein n=1 Tax=Clavelina lepadiformis TaxID=159417 RepID=A0ABP0H3X7_CLALP